MASSVAAAVKFQTKVENVDSDSLDSLIDSTYNESANQPSTSGGCRRSRYDSDSDCNEADVTPANVSMPQKDLEVVDIVSSSEEEREEDVSSIHTPRKAGLRQLTKRKSFKARGWHGVVVHTI